MPQKYSRVLSALTDQPWAIRQSALETMCAVVQARADGVELTKDEIQARIAANARPTQQIIGTVGVIPVYGILAQRMNMFLDISGGTSYQQLLSQFRVMRDDPQVKAIVFEHDSPGGEVFGLLEAAEEIFSARDRKRLIAVVNPCAASASLFLAAACHEIVVTPSGQVGCIGTILCHTDYSKQNEMLGEDPTYIVSSPYKAEANPDEPLGDEALKHLQAQVDAYGDQFEKFVAKGRGVTVAQVKADFGGGRMLLAKDAVKAGLADRVATFDDTIAKLVGRRSVNGARSVVIGPAVGAVTASAQADGAGPDEEIAPVVPAHAGPGDSDEPEPEPVHAPDADEAARDAEAIVALG